MTTTQHIQSPFAAIRWQWFVILIAIFLLALVLRWHYVYTTVVPAPLSGDAGQYYVYAWNLVHHGFFSLSPAGSQTITPDNYRDPGYPFFLALWIKALGANQTSYEATLLCQALLGALTVSINMLISRQWLSISWTTAAGLLTAIWPHCIAINGFLLTETLSGFLCSLGLLFWAQACVTQRHGLALASGFFLGMAALTNAVLQPFGILLAAFIALRAPSLRKICLTLALASAILPAAWALRNAHIPPVNIHSSSKGRALQNLVQGSWPDYHSAWRISKLGDDKARAEATATLNAMNREYDLLLASPREGAKEILSRLGQHPFAYLAWYVAKKPYELWGWDIEIGQGDIYPYPVIHSPFQISATWIALAALCHTLNPLLFVLALVCLPLVCWWPASQRISNVCQPLMSVIGLLAFVTLVYSALQAEPRYAIPFRGQEIMLAFTALASLSGHWKIRQHVVAAGHGRSSDSSP
jgi:hypothetical protein